MTAPEPGVEALVVEEDTYLVLSAAPEVREPRGSRLRTFHEAYATHAAAPGSVVVREGSPVRLLAVVHDLSREPSWTEEWVAEAVAAALREAEARGVRSLALWPLGRVHGALPRETLVSLLRTALESGTRRQLARICLVVPEDEAGEYRALFAANLWA